MAAAQYSIIWSSFYNVENDQLISPFHLPGLFLFHLLKELKLGIVFGAFKLVGVSKSKTAFILKRYLRQKNPKFYASQQPLNYSAIGVRLLKCPSIQP